jgi:hypothetical protein
VNAQKKPDPRDLRYVKFVTGRLDDHSVEEIAGELGFGSAAALYRQLNSDGYPVCPECGAAPEPGEHCAPSRKRRLAKGDGETVALPPAAGAAELFEGALERFRADVTIWLIAGNTCEASGSPSAGRGSPASRSRTR